MRRSILAVILGLALAFGLVQAQTQTYRWVDEQGKVRYSDRAPPPTAKSVEKKTLGGSIVETSRPPYALERAMKTSPVTLYTAPTCQEACSQARAALNRRGVPFKEVAVWNAETNDELKRVSGGNEVPVLVVGRTVQKGFEQGAFDRALEIGGYPEAGSLPPRAQTPVKTPEGYVSPEQRAAQGAGEPPKKQEETAKPTGPYAPRFSK